MLLKKHRKRSIACQIGMSPLHTYLNVFNFWFKSAEIWVIECRRLTISTNAQDFFIRRLQGDSPYQSRYGESASLCITDVFRVGSSPYHRYAESVTLRITKCRVADSPYHRYAEQPTPIRRVGDSPYRQYCLQSCRLSISRKRRGDF
jgi:hypothetical protein